MAIHKLNLRRFFTSILTVTALALTGLAFAGPSDGLLDETHASVRAVVAVQGQVTDGLMAMEGVLGTAVGLDNNGKAALVVYVDRSSASAGSIVLALPAQLRGAAVKAELTEKFVAFPGHGGGGAISHTAKQTPPIQLGTSGGWRNDL